MSFLGYLSCPQCGATTYIHSPNDVKLWSHPWDSTSVAEVTCKNGHVVRSKIHADHLLNFKARGCVVLPFGAQFDSFEESDIEGWDIDRELEELFAG